MKHLRPADAHGLRLPESFVVKATGRYYTAMPIAARMCNEAIGAWTRADFVTGQQLRLADPFGGDGRLIAAWIRAWAQARRPTVKWRITAWDLHEEGLTAAASQFEDLRVETGLDIRWELEVGDAFCLARTRAKSFDVLVSNPPWELLKPDRRELKLLPTELATSYVDAMRDYDDFLARAYPLAQPSRKFA